MKSLKNISFPKNGMTLLELLLAVTMMVAMASGISIFAAIPAKTQAKNRNFQKAEFSSTNFALYAAKEFNDNLDFPGDDQTYLAELEDLLASRPGADNCSIGDVSVGEAYAAAVVTCEEGLFSEVRASSSSNIVVEPSSSSGNSGDKAFEGSTWQRVGNNNNACDNEGISSDRYSPAFIEEYLDSSPTYVIGSNVVDSEDDRCYKLKHDNDDD